MDPSPEVENVGGRNSAYKLRASDIRRLYALAKKLALSTDYEHSLDVVVEDSISLLGADRGYLVHRDGERLVFYRRWGLEERRASKAISRRIVADAIDEQGIVVIDDAQSSKRYSQRDSVRLHRIRSVLCAPLEGDDDIVLYFESQSPGHFSVYQRHLLEEILELASTTIEHYARSLPLKSSRALFEDYDFRGIVAQDPVTLRLLADVARAAKSKANVLVQGPSGAGKELFVAALHRNSRRAQRRLVTVNCAALSESLIHSELFGHRRGSFTGATESRAGLVASADQGTLFLDEVGDLPLDVQAKLLRTIQFGEIQPVGSDDIQKVSVRFVSATHRDLEEEVRLGRFRQDFLYRINTLTVQVPPLAARKDDIVPLFEFFLREHARHEGVKIPKLTSSLKQRLRAQRWPGNVRELANEAQRLLLARPGASVLDGSDLSLSPELENPPSLHSAEKRLIEEHLGRVAWNISAAARALGITREGLRKKMKRLGIARPV